jgi:hypothetical protein
MRVTSKAVIVGVIAGALAACNQSSPVSPTMSPGGRLAVQTGNGAPSGGHYNLNIIGVKEKNASIAENSGHVIFVKLWGSDTRINLIEGDEYRVLDMNGTDGTAAFQLPNPDPDGDGTTVYSVFARALGKRSGSADMTTCATDPDDGETVCSVITLELDAGPRPAKFENVSKYLLYIYADIDDDGTTERLPLFDDRLEGYFWDYDNSGLKLAQLRFYQCSSTVPDPTNPGGDTTTTCFD